MVTVGAPPSQASAAVPGEEFAVDEGTPAGPDSVRLSFATGTPAELAEAARRLATVCP